MRIYTLTQNEVDLINSMGLVVCDHGLGYIGVDPDDLQQEHLDALGGFDADRVVEFDLDDQELAVNLAAKKQERIQEIDAQSARLVTSGIEAASGKVISTSMAAHQNLQDLMLILLAGTIQFPQGVSTLDGDEYTILDEDDFNRLINLVQVSKLTILNAGRQLRKDVLAATTTEALDLVVDTRE